MLRYRRQMHLLQPELEALDRSVPELGQTTTDTWPPEKLCCKPQSNTTVAWLKEDC